MNRTRTVIIAAPVLLCGGTEIQTLALARVLRNAEFRVVVCCYYEFDARMVTEFERAKIEVHLMRLQRPDSGTSYAGMTTLMLRLWRYFRKVKPEFVHVQYLAPGLLPIIAARLAGVGNIFATIHYPRYSFGSREQRFVRMAARMCSMFFCNSAATERSWFGSAKVYDGTGSVSGFRHCTVYNSVDSARIRTLAGSVNVRAAKAELHAARKPVVGIVARLRSEKGHEFLLRSMKRVLEKVPNAVLLVVGDGPDVVSLQELAGVLQIAEHVRWLGTRSHDEALKLFGVMDVAVVPSKFEGFGLSAAEAMAAEVPVVAADVDGLREVVGDCGMLVPFGGVERLAAGVAALLRNRRKGREMGKRGRLRVVELFSPERFREATRAAYLGEMN